MNYPAASCGVSNQTEEFELLTMQFLVCLLSTLFLNMRRNALLIAKLTNGKDERSFRPKLASPESFLHHWYASEYLSGYDTFDRLHKLLGTIHIGIDWIKK